MKDYRRILCLVELLDMPLCIALILGHLNDVHYAVITSLETKGHHMGKQKYYSTKVECS